VGLAPAERPLGARGSRGAREDPGVPLAVLLAEHEPEVAELARRYLARAGLRVTVATRADDTIAALTACLADVAVLDLTMPGLDARRVRRLLAEPRTRDTPPAEHATPAVYLLGPSMRPRDLRVSADRSLRRPFSPRMLVSHVLSAAGTNSPGTQASAISRTSTSALVPPAPGARPAPSAEATVRSLTLDPATRRARAAGRDIPLTPAEFALLSALAAHPGRVLTRDRLRAAMERPSSGRAVDVQIAQLRAKLGRSAAIRTVRGVGYILDAPMDAPLDDPRRAHGQRAYGA
jgi:DNA-binding response OmpR family regulator